jgi:hypothetical protein
MPITTNLLVIKRIHRKSLPATYFGRPIPSFGSEGRLGIFADSINLINEPMVSQALHIVQRHGLYYLIFSRCLTA